MKKVKDVGEFGLIDRLLPIMQPSAGDLLVGPGDDACAIRTVSGLASVLTTDMLVEDIHFRLDWQRPEELGWKAGAANLSDLAAMGASPRWLLVSLGCPPGTEVQIIEGIYRGLAALCRESGAGIAGGDTCRSDRLVLSITALGECEEDRVCTFDGAKAGEKVYATACPGLSGLGLKLLQRYGRNAVPDAYEESLAAHLRPSSPLKVAPLISDFIRPRAMTDCSDGLARDLGKIAQASGVRIRIDLDQLSWHKDLVAARKDFGWDPVELAFHGGEDYCLLFTAAGDRLEQAKHQRPELKRLEYVELGSVEEGSPGLSVMQNGQVKEVESRGYDHFSGQEQDGAG